MKWAFFTVLLIRSLTLLAQNPERAYEQSIQAYRDNKLDSADYYIGRAIDYYKQHAQGDSLVYAYVHQALVVWTQTGLDEAVEVTRTAIAVAETLPLKSVARVAAYSRMGQLVTQQYDFKQAAEYFRRAERAVNPAEPPNRHYALLYNYIAVMYLTLEDYVPAKRYVQRAYDTNLAVEGRDGRDMTMILQVRYFISRYREDYQQALIDAKEFQRVIQLYYPPDHPNIGVMHNSLAIIYETLLRYDEALYHRQKAVDIQIKNYKHTTNGFSLGAAYQNLGQLYGYIHEPFLAQEYLQKGSRLLAETYGEDGLGMVNIWVDMAVHKTKIGQYDEAEQLLKKALHIQEMQDADNVSEMAYIAGYFGDLYKEQIRYDEASVWYRNALEKYRQAGMSHQVQALNAKKNLAVTMAAAGQVDAALALEQEVLVQFRRLYPAGNDAIAEKLHGISDIYFDAGQTAKALAFSDSVFTEILQWTSLPAQTSDWISQLPFNYNTAVYVHKRLQILQQLHAHTDDDTYLTQLLSVVDGYAVFISDNLHAFRSQAALIDLADMNKQIYAMAVDACWELSAEGKHPRYLELAFGYAERGKALLLRLAANNMLVDAANVDRDTVEMRDQDFRTRIAALNLQFLNNGRSDSLLALLSATMEQYRGFQDSLKHAGDNAFSQKNALHPHSTNEIRKYLLGPDETLVEYAVTEQSVFIFVLTQRSFHVHRADPQVLDGINDLNELHGLSADAFGTHAYALYRDLIQPVQSYFTDSRLLIVPDAALYALNFEILISDRSSKRFSEMPYLIRKYNISYLLSATSATQFKRRFDRKAKARALLFAPVFTDEMKANYRRGLVNPEDDYVYLYRQPFALQAALQIGRFVNHDLYAEEQAQEAVFKQLAADYRILHFGTHAEVNNQSPLQSRLFFAKALADDTLNVDDGYLYAYEIYAMQLRAELAVLTACETGTGAWRNGEGVISLAHSFMHAGCASVVMSLWKIDEKASAEIIAGFYEFLAKGKSKSTSLQASKLRWIERNGERLAHPYYWAGLAIIGDVTPLYTNYSRWYVLGALLVLAIAGVIFFQHRKCRGSRKTNPQ